MQLIRAETESEVEVEDEMDDQEDETRQILSAALEILSKDGRLTMRPGRISQVVEPVKKIEAFRVPRPSNVILKSGQCNHQQDEIQEQDEPAYNGRRAMVATGVARNPYTGLLHPVYRPVYRPLYRPVVYPLYG